MSGQPGGKGGYGGSQVVATPSAVVISLTEAQQQQAQECLAKNAQVRFTFREITVTQLPETLDNGVTVD